MGSPEKREKTLKGDEVGRKKSEVKREERKIWRQACRRRRFAGGHERRRWEEQREGRDRVRGGRERRELEREREMERKEMMMYLFLI